MKDPNPVAHPVQQSGHLRLIPLGRLIPKHDLKSPEILDKIIKGPELYDCSVVIFHDSSVAQFES
jgi:hypothetical protein